jgi:hypothetical protein
MPTRTSYSIRAIMTMSGTTNPDSTQVRNDE